MINLFSESGIPFEIVQAFDINTVANKIYQHNFPDVQICVTRIEVHHDHQRKSTHSSTFSHTIISNINDTVDFLIIMINNVRFLTSLFLYLGNPE